MKATVLLISTYPELTTLARRYARHLNVPVEIYEGGISYGGHLYAKRREKDFEVFLSHGGTAAVIQQMLKKPVVEVKIHTSDLLQAYQRAASYGRPIVLMAYESEVMQQLEAVAGLFPDTPCRSLSYGSKEEYENIERKLGRLEGYTILGVGNCVRRIGEKNRCPYVQIVSQPDDVFEALSSARKILDLGMREKTWNHRLSTIINCSNEGILVFDKEGRVILANTIAENQIDCDGPLAGKKASIPATPELVRLLYGDGKPLREGFVRTGGSDFFCNRLSVDVNDEKEELIVKFQRVRDIQSIELKARLQLVDKGLVGRNTFESLIGDSPAFRETLARARQFSRSSVSVLVEGETGTGKELFVQGIHNESPCAGGPFVAINCAALPESLLESELFGYEGGAFTGARKGGKPGLFEMAHNGTIFLDEISEISRSIQARMLRVLQEREILRIGGDRVINVNIRVVTATNKNLYRQVLDGDFRQDLYFRISPLKLRIPPLRERKSDIPALVSHFLRILNEKYGTQVEMLSSAGLQRLQGYGWPGNIRELEFFVEKLVVLSDGTRDADELVAMLLEEHMREHAIGMETDCPSDIRVPIGSMKSMQNSIIDTLLKNTGGNKKLVSEILDISRVTIWNRMKTKNGA